MTKADNMMIVRFNSHIHLRLGEWLASAILGSIGLMLIAFPTMFASNVVFGALASTFNQETWALAFTIVGFSRLVALYVNGRKSITPYIRMGMAFISCFIWYQFALGLALSGIPNTGLAVYPWLLCLDIYNVFRSSADARDVYDKKRASRDGTNEA